MLNGGAVLWRSTRQSTASTGTAEAECKAAGFAGQQLIPLRDLMGELGFEQPSVRMMEDNSATVTLSYGDAKTGKHGHFIDGWWLTWKGLPIEVFSGWNILGIFAACYKARNVMQYDPLT